MLLLALLIGVPAPPQCPWIFSGGADVLLPSGGMVPRNASFWIRDYGDRSDLAVFDQSTGSSIAVDRTEIDLTSTGGRLLRLRPTSLLTPGTTYELDVAPYTIQVTATSTTDDTPPARPEVTAVRAISSPYEVCQTAGIIIDVADPGEPVIQLIEDPADGSLYELGVSFNYVIPNRAVPTDANASIAFRVVAIDLAGNRSDATADMTGMAAGVPQVQGKLPIDPNNNNGGGLARDRPGCSCNSTASTASPFLLLVLVPWRRKRS